MSVATFDKNEFDLIDAEFFGSKEQDKKFANILALLIVVYVVFAIVIPFVDRIEIPRAVKEQIPPQLTRIMLKEKQTPTPEKMIEKTKTKAEDIKIEDKVSEEKVPEKIIDTPIKLPKTKQDIAKKKAKSSGLAAMKDELFSMRDAFEVNPNVTQALTSNKTEQTKVKRKLLSAKANLKSQGIESAKISKVVTSDELSTHNTQKVRLSEEELIAEASGVNNTAKATLANIRSEMKLRQTLEGNKARLYTLYNRVLRKDPFLKGKVLFEIEILPNGKVNNVIIQTSELNNTKLERQLTLILKSIDFGEENVEVMKTIWAIEFLPR